MKIFHDPHSNLQLTKYGIEIPLSDNRDFKIYDFLQQRNIPIISDAADGIAIKREDLQRVHTKEFVSKLYGTEEEIRGCIIEAFELINEKGDYHRYRPHKALAPLHELFPSVLLKTTGTMRAVDAALMGGSSFFLGGGFHHAMSFGGRGFCLINDVVIAARWAQFHQKAQNIWVIDVDAHKGDGTAELTQNDSSIATLSIHMKDGWPLDQARLDSKGMLRPWFIPSDVDIEIAQGEENLYLPELQAGLELLAKKSHRPDLAIVVQGADPYELDQLPSASRLKLTKEQMLARDLLVYNFLSSRQIPQAYVLAGGYGEHVYEIYCQFLARIL